MMLLEVGLGADRYSNPGGFHSIREPAAKTFGSRWGGRKEWRYECRWDALSYLVDRRRTLVRRRARGAAGRPDVLVPSVLLARPRAPMFLSSFPVPFGHSPNPHSRPLFTPTSAFHFHETSDNTILEVHIASASGDAVNTELVLQHGAYYRFQPLGVILPAND
jgi:hypothetical protein